MDYVFHAAPFVVYGRNIRLKIVDYLKRWNAENNVLLVHGKHVKAAGLVDDIAEKLQEAGYTVFAFDKVVSDAPVEVIREGVEFAREKNIRTVIAIGGGSGNDIAKAIAMMLDNEGDITQYVGVDQFPKRRRNVLVAIPTTCGTGSEITDGGVIYFAEQSRKISFWDSAACPDIALLDPVLLEKLSDRLIAQTALDALAHAVEGYTSILANPISDALALGAMEQISKNLPLAYQKEDKEEALGALLSASTIAGMSFNRSTVHLGHALAHALGALTHIHHGAACAFALPLVLKTQAEVIPGKIRKICGAMGFVVPEDDAQLGAAAAECMQKFAASFGVTKLEDFGIQQDQLDDIAVATCAERIIAISPRRCTQEEISTYLKSRF